MSLSSWGEQAVLRWLSSKASCTSAMGGRLLHLLLIHPGKAGMGGGLFFAILVFVTPPDESLLRKNSPPVVYSSEGVELREFRSRRTGAFQRTMSLEDYPESLVEMVLRSEDSRFYIHPGVDPGSALRALAQNLRSFRIVSGASTIPMQLARIIYKDQMYESIYLRKVQEALYAFRMKLWFSNGEILEAYLNQVPLAKNSAGFPSASIRIFHKNLQYLSREEQALLVVLLRGNPHNSEILRSRILRLLDQTRNGPSPVDQMEKMELALSAFEKNEQETFVFQSAYSSGHRAPHFIDYLMGINPDLQGRFYSSISSDLTGQVEEVVRNELGMIEQYNGSNAAVVVLEKNEKKQEWILRALVGSRGYSEEQSGQVNGALAMRSAGSTLKPFVYALGMDRFGYKPYSILEDEQIAVFATAYGDLYRAKNYDLNFWGSMTLREALATSRNIPPVVLMDQIGPDQFSQFMDDLGVKQNKGGPEQYGPGIALGTAGIHLLDLTAAYSVFSSRGVRLPVFLGTDQKGRLYRDTERKELISEKAAFWITDILSDRSARKKAFGPRNFLDFPFPVAAKTGTSKDFRDSWTVGYTNDYVVGVWVGNFNNEAMNDVSGVYGAGRIMHQVIRILHPHGSKPFPIPDGFQKISVCTKTGKLANDFCPSIEEYISQDEVIPEICERHGDHFLKEKENQSPIIDSPAPGEVFYLDPHIPRSAQAIPLQIRNCKSCKLYLNGKLVREVSGELRMGLEPVRGEHTLDLLWEGGTLSVSYFLK